MISQSLDDEIMVEVLTKIVENMQEGWDEDDIVKFSRDFSGEMRSEMTPENFKSQRDEIYPDFGNHTALRFLALHRNPTNIVLMLSMSCEKRVVPALLVYHFKETDEGFTIVGANLHS